MRSGNEVILNEFEQEPHGRTHTLKWKMADEEVFLTTGASEDNVCISLWGVNSGILLKSYKGGSCPSRSVCLLGKDFILASQVNKSVIHVWHTAKVSNFGGFRGIWLHCLLTPTTESDFTPWSDKRTSLLLQIITVVEQNGFLYLERIR